MQEKAHRIIWDSYHVFKEKTKAGIVDIPKSNLKKEFLENVLFKKTGEEEQVEKKKKMRRAGQVSLILWCIMTLVLKNPKRRITQGLLSLLYIVVSLVAGGSGVWQLRGYLHRRRLHR